MISNTTPGWNKFSFPRPPIHLFNKSLYTCSSKKRIILCYCLKMMSLTISVLIELPSVSLELDYVIDISEWDLLNQDIYWYWLYIIFPDLSTRIDIFSLEFLSSLFLFWWSRLSHSRIRLILLPCPRSTHSCNICVLWYFLSCEGYLRFSSVSQGIHKSGLPWGFPFRHGYQIRSWSSTSVGFPTGLAAKPNLTSWK